MLFSPTVRRRLVWAVAGCVVLPWVAGETVKRWLQGDLGADAFRTEMMIDFIVAGSVMTALILLFTVAVGCWVTAVMKGPRYTADSFPVDSLRDGAR